MNHKCRIWCQQDFAQIYEEEPKVKSCPTYITIHLFIESQLIDVKIPSNASQEVFKFLLYKATYFHYLNMKSDSPLYKTALISCFQSSENYGLWHNLWSSGAQIPKNARLQCVYYLKDESLFKYLILAMIEQNEQYRKILGRSRRDGKYYNIIQYDHDVVTEQHLNFLQTSFKVFQHPFVSRLCQVHKTQSHTYFIFEHIPFSLGQILHSDIKLTKQQVYTCFIEFLMVLIFFEQQQLFVTGLDLHMIDVNIDGHLAINQKIVCFCQDTQTQRNRNNATFLSQFFNILISASDLMDQKPLMEYQNHVNFAKFLLQFTQRKKISLKQILNHPWIQKKSIQNILAKNNQGLDVKKLNKTLKYDQITINQRSQFFNKYNKKKQNQNSYESYQIHSQTSNQMILYKYDPQNQTQRSNKISNRSFKTLVKTNSSTSKTHMRNESLESKHTNYGQIPKTTFQTSKQSPYCMVLKKQGCLKRKKPLRI